MQVTECRNQIVSPKSHNSAYCENCQHYCIPDVNRLCLCCRQKLSNSQKKHQEFFRKFDKLISENQTLIEGFNLFPSLPEYRPSFKIRMGIYTHEISIKYLAEYLELPELEGLDKYERFFKTIKEQTPIVPPYGLII